MVVEVVESCDGSPGSAFTPLSAAAVREQRDYQRSRGCRIQPSRGGKRCSSFILFDKCG